jgi:uncharacterized SAM-dependent methyltransferase
MPNSKGIKQDIEDEADELVDVLEELRDEDISVERSVQLESCKNSIKVNSDLYKAKLKDELAGLATDSEVAKCKHQLMAAISLAKDAIKQNQQSPSPVESPGIISRKIEKIVDKDAIKQNHPNPSPIESPEIISGKIEKIVGKDEFNKWILSFVGEEEIENLKDIIYSLCDENGKRIVSGYSYWGAMPTERWFSACGAPGYIMFDSIRKFPGKWKKIYYSSISGTPYNYLSLGVGDGQKDISILSSLINNNPDIMYFPIDMSPEMLHRGTRNVMNDVPGLRRTQVLPMQLDFSNEKKLGKIRSIIDILNNNKYPTLFGLLGNTLANFDDDYELLGKISDMILKPGDFLLLELAKIDLINTETKKKAKEEYREEKFRKFAICSLLQATNIDFDERGKGEDKWPIDIDKELLSGGKKAKGIKISVYYKNKSRDKPIVFPTLETFNLAKGEKIRLYLSRKYTNDGIDDLIAKSRLEKVKCSLDRSGTELLLLKRSVAKYVDLWSKENYRS